MAIKAAANRTEKVKITLWSVVGLILLPAGLAYTSIAFSAWIVKLTAVQKFSQIYEVHSVLSRSGAVWTRYYEIELLDISSGEIAYLPSTKDGYEKHLWNPEDQVCLIGRTSIFGTIIDSINNDIARCDNR